MKILFIGIFFLWFNLCSGQDNLTNTTSSLQFDNSTHDFGDVMQGNKVDFTFKYKNSSKEPIVISEVLTTCGCTATKWSKEPLLSGQDGEINVTFNSENKMGRQNKVITIISNAEKTPTRLTISANILPQGKNQ